ncbi:hypothetical protein [Nocardiopsis dassonvillei]|uniref:hypothetical protein n=1 Tax=Nocardiopsis dassonvillei TaxID=2014 RepID=UPI00362D66AD
MSPDTAELMLPIYVALALAAVTWLGYLLGSTGLWLALREVRRQRAVIRRQDRSIRTLEADLAAERELVARLSKPAADLLADVYAPLEENRG